MTSTAAAFSAAGGRVDTSGEGEPDVFVLHDRALRPGTDLAVTSRFIDQVWRLDPAQPQRHRAAMTLNFSVLPVGYQVTAKQLCHAQLSGPLPPGERRPRVATVARTLSDLMPFLRWLDNRDAGRVDELATTDLLAYQRHLLGEVRDGRARHRARGAVRMLWRYRDSLDHPLRFDPRHLDEWGEPHRGAAVENATDRIPEPVLGPLIGWAMRFVDDFAPDILAAHRRWQRLRRGEPRTTRRHRGEGRQRLAALLEVYREQNRPLPSRDGHPNYSYLAVLAGCGETGLFRHREEIDAAAAELGLDRGSAIDTPISGTLDGRPWLTAILTDHRAADGVGQLTRQLQAACYILIAYLSGMRDSEIKHLRRGCLRIDRDRRGVAHRWSVTSLAFKGEDAPEGAEATWIIGHPAARAIAVLQQLQPPTTELLFTVLPSVGTGQAARASNDALSSAATCRQLNSFVSWVNDYCAERGRADPIPHVNRRVWRLTTSQFRRTLAWFIARRPGGAIAGAIQYRHHAVQMFEGYAGTSDSGFRAEVESEQALARGEHLLGMIDEYEHKTLAGPAAATAGQRLKDFGAQARFAGAVITDPRRLTRLLRREDPAIHPGTYVTCVFDPDKALCLKQGQRPDRPERDGPRLRDCQPMACANVALTPANTTVWQAEIGHIDQRLAERPPLPPLLAARLHDRRAEVTGFLTRHHQERP